MYLSTLYFEHLRNLNTAELSLSPEFNIITGDNGSGKTSFLEAVFLLSRGISFKTRNSSLLIQSDTDNLIVRGQLSQSNDFLLALAIAISFKNTQIKIGELTSPLRSELSSTFPLQLIHPDNQNLLEGSPKQRRQFLDWGVFHVEHRFFNIWKAYARILKQRNALLRTSQTRMGAWDQELNKYGNLLTQYRNSYMHDLLPYVNTSLGKLLGINNIEIIFQQGWQNGYSLFDCLDKDKAKDKRYKATQSGSHRDNFTMILDGRPIQHTLSRGQMKIIVIALQFAQTQLLYEKKGIAACILLDDMFSELDRNNTQKMLEWLAEMKMQKIITGLNRSGFSNILSSSSCMFHVEQGRITS